MPGYVRLHELGVYLVEQLELALGAVKVAVYVAYPRIAQGLLAGELDVALVGEYEAVPCVRYAALLVEAGYAVVGFAYFLGAHAYRNAAQRVYYLLEHIEIHQHIFAEVEIEVAVEGFKEQVKAALYRGGVELAVAVAGYVHQHVAHYCGELEPVVYRVYGGYEHGVRVGVPLCAAAVNAYEQHVYVAFVRRVSLQLFYSCLVQPCLVV